MNKKEKTKQQQTDDEIENFDEFQKHFNQNEKLYFNLQEKNLKQSRYSDILNQNYMSQRNDFSQNKITGLGVKNLRQNNQSKEVKKCRVNSARYNNVIQSNFDEFQENQYKLPQIKSFSRGNEQIKAFPSKKIILPEVQGYQPQYLKRTKIYQNLVTDRIPQSNKKNLQTKSDHKEQSVKFQSLHELKDQQKKSNKQKDTLYKKDQFLQYLKLKNKNKQLKKNKQTIKNKQQNNNLTERIIKKKQKIQDLRKKTQQKKNQQNKIQQQKFFQQAKKNNPVFLQIIKKSQLKQPKVFKDQKTLFRKKISVLKSQQHRPKIKVGIQVEQQSQDTQNELKKDFSDFRIRNVKKTWQRLETMQEQCPQMSRIISYEQMNPQIDEDILKKSMLFKQEIKEEINQKIQSDVQLSQFMILLLKVTDQLQKRGKPVLMTQKSTVRSQISIRNLIGGFMDDYVKVQETISDQDPTCPFSYTQLQDPQEFQKFCAWYKIRTASQTGLDPNSIVIHCVAKGSIRVQWSTNEFQVLDAAFVLRTQLRRRLKLHSFFQSFQLSPEDFDPSGNIEFFQSKNYIQYRGGWPYYQPVQCKRYGINVLDKYDDGNNRWLEMKGRPGQWAVAFHAVRDPAYKKDGNKMSLNSIMSGLQNNSMLLPGDAQQRKYDQIVNGPAGEKVGVGIYCSPHIQETFYYSKPNYRYDGQSLQIQQTNPVQKKIQQLKQKYGLIFQCRVNPRQIRVSQRQQYWVIKETKNIRPYGIILIKRDIIGDYPSIEEQFGKMFDYDDFKDQIQNFLNKR